MASESRTLILLVEHAIDRIETTIHEIVPSASRSLVEPETRR